MKVCIVTVYNSYNCGSFLQAHALYKTLLKKGIDVTFLKREPYRVGTLHYRVCMAIKACLKCNPVKAYFIIKEHFMFKKMQKKLPKVSNFEGIDLVIYGSDTIWNIDAKYFRENWEKYWGRGVNNKKITYAASVGSTDADKFYRNPDFKKCINDFSGVGVRDVHTYCIAEKLLDIKTPVMVIDPTMLLSIDEYRDITGECKEKDFILLYYFGNMPKKQKKQLKEFAKCHNKKIITFGKNIPFYPELMLSYYKAADYVVTNTFHGNVFSIIFNKNFISFGSEQKKVVGILKEFELSHRLLNNDDDIGEILLSDIDYCTVNSLLNKKKEQSLKYLEQFVC